jgi:D-serine deaminase-like pyridoxal phosphate-dependent protein
VDIVDIGQKIYELDTPSLLLDLDKLEANIKDMSEFAAENNLAIRPHIKTHKSVKIAKMQMEAGAIGITVAKISEAEVMVAGGINDILVAYPISKQQKIHRVLRLLSKGVNLKIAVDHIEQLKYLQKDLEHSPFVLEVWIKVNSGLDRCGVESVEEVIKLAQAVFLSKIKLGGIFTHAGHSYAAKTQEEIRQIAIQEGNVVAESAIECERVGIPIPIRSVGSTPTYRYSGLINGINEVRPGNAVFFDHIQVGLGSTTIEKCALTILSSVVGVYSNRIVIDAGSKTLCLDKGAHGNETVKGFGSIINHQEIMIERLSEEHGIGNIKSSTTLKRNDAVEIIPNHACTVVNQFDHYIIHRAGRVVDSWNVDARGMNQ